MAVKGVARRFGSALAVVALTLGGATVVFAQVSDNAVAVVANVEDAANLKMMFEEERMAHDLYVAFGEKWGSRKFSNISNAETRHNSVVGAEMDRLGVAKPDTSVAGKYENSEIQALYDGWLARGLESQQEAFVVGAELERRDIADLEKVMDATLDQQLKDVYGRLLDGSKKHLAAFEASTAGKGGQQDWQMRGQKGQHRNCPNADNGAEGWRGGRA